LKTTSLKDLNETLFPFQRKAVEFHLSHHYSINGCKMGLGKTIQAIATLAHVQGPACIVCPAYLRQNWLSEMDKFLPENHSHKITVISYEKFVRFAPDSCHILIFDEAHYLKNMLSKRSKFAHNYVKSKLPTYLLLLTGTPIKNRVTDFYSPMKLCSYNPKKTSGLCLTKGFTVFADTLCDSVTINTP
jgi:SNF2 family DNA or RNA helicase